MATAVVAGTMIGSGVFVKPRVIAADVPYSGLAAVAWILGGVLALLGALAYAEVAVLYPLAGGNYVFLREAYGRLAGFLWGWVEFWMIRSASIAALATIFTDSLVALLSSEAIAPALGQTAGIHLDFWPQKALTVLVILLLAYVNVRGVRWGGLLQLFLTTVKVVSLVAIAALPFLAYSVFVPAVPDTVGFRNLDPVWPEEGTPFPWSGMGAALLGVLWAYHGWMNIAPVAGEVRDPQRNIPIALVCGVGLVMALYLGANLAYHLTMNSAEMAALPPTTRVVAAFGGRILGSLGVVLASAAVMISVFGSLNGNLMVGPRLLYAMGEDRLAPAKLSEVHPTYRTPALAIWVVALWSALLAVGGAVVPHYRLFGVSDKIDPFDLLTNYAMFGAVIFETMAVLSIFVFRYRYPDAPRPYRCPFYPLVPALYVVLPAFILVNMFVATVTEVVAGLIVIGVGALVYLAAFASRPASE